MRQCEMSERVGMQAIDPGLIKNDVRMKIQHMCESKVQSGEIFIVRSSICKLK